MALLQITLTRQGIICHRSFPPSDHFFCGSIISNMHKDRGCRGYIRLLRQILVFISEFYGLNMHNDNSMTISSTFIKMYLISVKPRPGKVLALKVLKLVWIWICSGEDKSRSKIFPASIFVTIVRR